MSHTPFCLPLTLLPHTTSRPDSAPLAELSESTDARSDPGTLKAVIPSKWVSVDITTTGEEVDHHRLTGNAWGH